MSFPDADVKIPGFAKHLPAEQEKNFNETATDYHSRVPCDQINNNLTNKMLKIID